MTGKESSILQERHICKVTGGKTPANSGGTLFGGGDVLTDKFLIEAKTVTTPKKSHSIKKEWLDKAKEQAFEQGKENYALAINFEPNGENYYIVDEKTFLNCIFLSTI